jgi:DNA methylase
MDYVCIIAADRQPDNGTTHKVNRRREIGVVSACDQSQGHLSGGIVDGYNNFIERLLLLSRYSERRAAPYGTTCNYGVRFEADQQNEYLYVAPLIVCPEAVVESCCKSVAFAERGRNLSRREAGRHYVLPLSADLQVRARRHGFDNLTPIRWQKVSNIKLEASRSARFLGKPNLPNGVVKNDIEHILFFRKPGGYRKPTQEQEELSFISTDDYAKWFSPVWTDVTGQQRTKHPAPYPLEIPRRLIRMFSFVGDTVVDTFAGTGTTALAAMETGRNSIGVEIEPSYVDLMADRLRHLPLTGKVVIHRTERLYVAPLLAQAESK